MATVAKCIIFAALVLVGGYLAFWPLLGIAMLWMAAVVWVVFTTPTDEILKHYQDEP